MLRFLANEAGSAVLLLAATVAAVAWANIPGARYEAFWSTQTLFRVGTWSTSLDLRHWVNDAAMAVFFLVVGLEISREVTVGELRNRRTVVVPALGAVGGLVLPALLYLAFEHSGPATTGWGIPICFGWFVQRCAQRSGTGHHASRDDLVLRRRPGCSR